MTLIMVLEITIFSAYLSIASNNICRFYYFFTYVVILIQLLYFFNNCTFLIQLLYFVKIFLILLNKLSFN